ncbi:hypothetical protein M231_05399 [Tremella mesenterica]|uniref:BTB domain-containing protein n=1 Tax=Tremella mesenterica TaxID=5217 RepID=A0A4Q1BI64_TREME|nr:hypothetical protein M231_05399 [Tremella mesenterica]
MSSPQTSRRSTSTLSTSISQPSLITQSHSHATRFLNSRTPTPSSRRREVTLSGEYVPGSGFMVGRGTRSGTSGTGTGLTSNSTTVHTTGTGSDINPFDDGLHLASVIGKHEWEIRGVEELRRYLEDDVIEGANEDREEESDEIPRILQAGVMMKDDLHRLDLARTLIQPSPQSDIETPFRPIPGKTLSLYIKSCAMDKIKYDGIFTVSIFVGISPPGRNTGQRYSPREWLWTSETEWDFSVSTDLYELVLPPLSTLLSQLEEYTFKQNINQPSGNISNVHSEEYSKGSQDSSTPRSDVFPKDIQNQAFNTSTSVEEGKDTLVLVVQIESPPRSTVTPTKSQVEVPTDMIMALGELLDTTPCDVRFVCAEHILNPGVSRDSGVVQGHLHGLHDSLDRVGDVIGGDSSNARVIGGDGEETETETREEPKLLSRKRTIYAHSAILKARSEYFRDLLTGGFSEAQDKDSKSEGITTLVMLEEEFETVYWMLRFIYTNSLLFSPFDDPRTIMSLRDIDTSQLSILLSPTSPSSYTSFNPWIFQHLPSQPEPNVEEQEGNEHEKDFDARTVSSSSTTLSNVHKPDSSDRAQSVLSHTSKTSINSTNSRISRLSNETNVKSISGSTISTNSNSTTSTTSSATPRRIGNDKLKVSTRGKEVQSAHSPNRQLNSPNRSLKSGLGVGTTKGLSGTTTSSTLSGISGVSGMAGLGGMSGMAGVGGMSGMAGMAGVGGLNGSTRELGNKQSILHPDPNPHPTPQPGPASALRIYMLAHRYRLDMLESLAREHLVGLLNVDNAMGMLLVTYRYEILHRDIREYILDRWSSVKRSNEYSKCLDEIRSGFWGDDGWPAFRELVDELASLTESEE